jgi:hypothetical protein
MQAFGVDFTFSLGFQRKLYSINGNIVAGIAAYG